MSPDVTAPSRPPLSYETVLGALRTQARRSAQAIDRPATEDEDLTAYLFSKAAASGELKVCLALALELGLATELVPVVTERRAS